MGRGVEQKDSVEVMNWCFLVGRNLKGLKERTLSAVEVERMNCTKEKMVFPYMDKAEVLVLGLYLFHLLHGLTFPLTSVPIFSLRKVPPFQKTLVDLPRLHHHYLDSVERVGIQTIKIPPLKFFGLADFLSPFSL